MPCVLHDFTAHSTILFLALLYLDKVFAESSVPPPCAGLHTGSCTNREAFPRSPACLGREPGCCSRQKQNPEGKCCHNPCNRAQPCQGDPVPPAIAAANLCSCLSISSPGVRAPSLKFSLALHTCHSSSAVLFSVATVCLSMLDCRQWLPCFARLLSLSAMLGILFSGLPCPHDLYLRRLTACPTSR